jgi:SepF-like predicted cell division protein (DUF552 family)
MTLKAILDKILGVEAEEGGISNDYLELEEGGEAVAFDTPSRYIKVTKLKGFADIDVSARELSEGNIVIMDIQPLAQRSSKELKHAIDEIKDITLSMGGDIAGITEVHLIMTPPNVKIERTAETRDEKFAETMQKVKKD